MYFGVIRIKTCFIMLINTVIILLTSLIIDSQASVSGRSILLSNGFEEKRIQGFDCYTRTISEVQDNLHTLRYVQYITSKQLEQNNVTDYRIAIEVICKDNSYFIFDKNIDSSHRHCNLCHKQFSKDLVNVFNKKEDVQVVSIDANVGKLFVCKILSGLTTAIYTVIICLISLYAVLLFAAKHRQINNEEVKRCEIIFKTFTFVFICVFSVAFATLYLQLI